MTNATTNATRRKKAGSAAQAHAGATPRPTARSGPDTTSAPDRAASPEGGRAAPGEADAGVKARFIEQVAPEDSFADGAHSVTMARNVLKLDLYRVVRFDPAGKEELRNISHRIVLPMTAVPELVNLLQGVVQAAQGATNQQQARSDGAKAKTAQASAGRDTAWI